MQRKEGALWEEPCQNRDPVISVQNFDSESSAGHISNFRFVKLKQILSKGAI